MNPPVPRNPAGARERSTYDSRASEPLSNPPPENQHHHRHATYAAEASGLLIMAVVLLILTVIRYWREIPWSAR